MLLAVHGSPTTIECGVHSPIAHSCAPAWLHFASTISVGEKEEEYGLNILDREVYVAIIKSISYYTRVYLVFCGEFYGSSTNGPLSSDSTTNGTFPLI
jgi:hypothetical protein